MHSVTASPRSAALAGARTGIHAGSARASPVASPSRRGVATQALMPLLADVAPQVATSAAQVANQAATLAPGSVDAPAWVLPVAALVIAVVGGGSAILLKPGADAAEKIFERDARTRPNLNKRAEANKRAQQTIRGRK